MKNKYATAFGGSEYSSDSPEYQDGIKIGEFLVSKGYIVKCGGYYGLMEAIAKGVSNSGGISIGVTNAKFDPKKPNSYLNQVLKKRDTFDRIRTLINGSTLFIIQNGGIGTLEELLSVWCLRYTLQIKDVDICLIGESWPLAINGLKFLNIQEEEFLHLKFYRNAADFISQYGQGLSVNDKSK